MLDSNPRHATLRRLLFSVVPEERFVFWVPGLTLFLRPSSQVYILLVVHLDPALPIARPKQYKRNEPEVSDCAGAAEVSDSWRESRC